MPQLRLKDFRKMTGDYVPASISDTIFREIKGFFPPYSKFFGDVQAKGDTPFPLILSREVSALTGVTLSAKPIAMISSYALGNELGVDARMNVFAMEGYTSMGQPVALGSDNVGIDIIIFNDNAVVTVPTSGSAYRKAIDATTVWTAFGTLNAAAKHMMENFQSSLYITDSNGGTTDRRLIKIVNSSWTMSNGLDLGTNWFIENPINIDNRYLACPAQKGSGSFGKDFWYLFLWNGLASSSYDYAIKIEGEYRFATVTQGTYFMFVSQGPDLVAFILDNTSLKEVGRIKNMQFSANIGNPRNKVAVAGKYFIIPTNRGVLFWNIFEKESFFAYNDANTTVNIVLAQMITNSTPYNIYFGKNSSAGHTVHKFNMEGSTVVGSANFGTNFIEAKDLEGAPDRIQIDRIEYIYNTKPPSTGDIFGLTLTYQDDSSSATYSTHTENLNSASNIGATRGFSEKIGAKCTRFRVDLAVTAATTTWDLIIKEVIIHYTPIGK